MTIALPVYNGELYIAGALGSALAQTYRDVEIIVFDNASTDSTRDIVSSFGDAVRVITSDSNGGAAWNFSRSVEEARTPYFMWLAADDLLRPSYVEECVAALNRLPEAHFALTDIEYVDPEGHHLRTMREDGALASPNVKERLRGYLDRPRWTEVYSLYRTASLRSSGLFRPIFGCDVVLVWELLLRGPAALVPQPLLVYRVFPAKTVQEMAVSVTGAAEWLRWPNVGLWRNLWCMSEDTDDARTRRSAKRALLWVLGQRNWASHLIEDVRGEAERPGSSAAVRWAAIALTSITQLALRVRSGLRRA